MEILEEEENVSFVEVLIKRKKTNLFPPTFIPQGIDLDPVENPADTENVGIFLRRSNTCSVTTLRSVK